MAQAESPRGRVQAVGRVVRDQVHRLGTELRALDAAGWDAPSACEGWTVKDVTSHMAESNDRFFQIVSAVVRGDPAPEFTPAQRAERQAGVKAQPGGAIVDQLEQRQAATFDLLESASPEALARTVSVPAGQLSLAQVATQRLSECTLHSWDIRWAWDRGATLDPRAVPLLLEGVIGSAARLGSRGAPSARDATYHLELTGPAGGLVGMVVERGAVRASRGAPERADATVRLASEAFIRLLWGRLDLQQAVADGSVQVQGDRDLALAMRDIFRGV